MVDSKKTNQNPTKIMNEINAAFEVHQKLEEK